jgi:Na+/melibiose symporter-like transporter
MMNLLKTTGRYQEGMLAGIFAFFFQFALIFQAIILTIVHILTAYDHDPKVIQTHLAQIGIRIHLATIHSKLCLNAYLIV